ncbi:MAG: glycosyltransferase [Clostridia bacterium]|nr:glycosyltransferase [Clostridia bacterium]
MKVVQINANCGSGSTGKIVLSVSKLLDAKGTGNYILYSNGQSDYANGIKYTSFFAVKMEALFSRILGHYGFDAKSATKRLISHLEKIKPDIIHIHNIHSHDCNLKMLFDYIKAKNIKVYWTFHDCWAFTGYCPYFDIVNCNKWQTECYKCEQYRKYSWFFDRSKHNFQQKKKVIDGLDLTVITPSEWMANLAKKSFFKEYPVKVINNGIDLSVFKPFDSNFRKKHNCEDKFLILGVAFGWEERKGLSAFLELAKRLDDRFKIVLVGTNDAVDKVLPENIISINKTQNQKELAEIYSAADLFVNPTMEENYPTVNMEALACGTPVLTFNTGGCSEMLDESCGSVVPKGDMESLFNEILRIQRENPFSSENCLNKAKEFDFNQKFNEYVELYKE